VVDEHDFMPTPSLASVSAAQETSASHLFTFHCCSAIRTTTYPDKIEGSTPSSSSDLYMIHDSCDRRYSDRDHSQDILCLPPWSSRRSLRHWDRKGHRSWRHWNWKSSMLNSRPRASSAPGVRGAKRRKRRASLAPFPKLTKGEVI
jgi:hypothetical protein